MEARGGGEGPSSGHGPHGGENAAAGAGTPRGLAGTNTFPRAGSGWR